MMHLDFCNSGARGVPQPAFAQVGVKSSLCNKICAEFFYFLLKNFFIDIAHCEAFLAHFSFSSERFEELIRRVYHLYVYPMLLPLLRQGFGGRGEIFMHV